MTQPRALSLVDLKSIVSDPAELSKGVSIFDGKGLAHLARFENRLYADAAGSGAAPYKAQVLLADDKVTGRCSCMAARSRPFCKHAAALLVAWARAPEAFVVSDVAPVAAGGERKKKAVKAGKSDGQELMRAGVEQVATLVRELGVAGVAALAADRADQVRALAENLRENRLRRLSARTLELADLLTASVEQQDGFRPEAYAELMADLVLTARKLEKHLAGEPLDDRHVEELIGKTWTRKDRKPVAGLDLVEYASSTRETPDGFIIRESRFIDVKTGEHYAEKQIIPGFLARRTEPKRTYPGVVLREVNGSLFPSYAPLRLDVQNMLGMEELGQDALSALLGKSLPDVGAALKAFQDRRKDVFAPDLMPVAVRVDTVLAEGRRLRVVDAQDAALFLPEDAHLQERLAAVLRSSRLRGVVGEVALDGALPTLYPQALLVETPVGLHLRSMGAVMAADGRKVVAHRSGTQVSRWVDVARAAGVSGAAVMLGEVREEMAHAWVMGLGALSPRLVEPLVARIRELGLEKQADLLQALPGRPDAAERLDDFTKVYQLLAIAMTRLTGSVAVERASLRAVPTYESVHIRAVDERLEPTEIAARSARGELNRFEAADHYARFYGSIPADQLAAQIFPTWADGSAGPFVARAYADRPEAAVAAARRALGMRTGRVAHFTAMKVLEAVGSAEAQALLEEVKVSSRDRVMRATAARTLDRMRGRTSDPVGQEKLAVLVRALLSAPHQEQRVAVLEELEKLGDPEAIPYVRLSMTGDIARAVNQRAALTLGMLGDTESVDTFVRMLRARADQAAEARVAALALGRLGDVRGLAELLNAYAEGWQPAVIADAIKQLGESVLDPLLRFVEDHPALAERKAAQSVLAALPVEQVQAALEGRIHALKDAPDFAVRAGTLLVFAQGNAEVTKAAARVIAQVRPGLGEKGATDDEKALNRRVRRALGVVTRKDKSKEKDVTPEA
jgi:hypothetical protein